MTKAELLALKAHTRIKYIGKDQTLIDRFNNQGPRTALSKGVVFGYCSDYSTSTYSSYKGRGIVLRMYASGSIDNVVPEDWVVVDINRKDLAHSRERRNVKKTDAWVRNELKKFSDDFRNLKATKERIDIWLSDIPLADRFKILTTLDEEQKAWLHLISMDSEELIVAIKKIASDETETVEVSDGSDGQVLPLSPEAIVCPS